MRAGRFDETGDPDVIRIVEVDEPHPGLGQVRIRVRAAAVNAADWKYRRGRYKATLPLIGGSDAAGVVDEVGPGVERVAVGDRLLGNTATGAFAEFALLSDWATVPADMSWPEAAGLVMAVETATRALDAVNVGVGTTVVVNGASGGVGSAAVQLAVARGATVIGIAGPRNHEYLAALGATPVSYGDGMVEAVREVAPDGVDVAVDIAGSKVIPQLIELTGNPGQVVSIADFSAPKLGAKVTDGSEGRRWDALRTATELFEQGRFRVDVQQTFPLERLGDAHALLEDGHVRGKVVIEL
jgi:NADPH:quinone reductase-like Zn-dependent oxidoreductase